MHSLYFPLYPHHTQGAPVIFLKISRTNVPTYAIYNDRPARPGGSPRPLSPMTDLPSRLDQVAVPGGHGAAAVANHQTNATFRPIKRAVFDSLDQKGL